MTRALAIARVTVPPEQEAAYLAGAGALAATLRVRGQHLWVFRHPSRPGDFLEFRESGDDAAHTASAPTPAEGRLTQALRDLATAARVSATHAKAAAHRASSAAATATTLAAALTHEASLLAVDSRWMEALASGAEAAALTIA